MTDMGVLLLLLLVTCAAAAHDDKKRAITDVAYFDVRVTDRETKSQLYSGRLVIGLFGDVVPMTVTNFIRLTEGYMKEGKHHGYAHTKFHRVVPDFVVQGGDFMSHDGTGGLSIYGNKFDDENFDLSHMSRGWVAMANHGRDTNASQFYITLGRLRWLDGKNVVFGKVLQGYAFLKTLSGEETSDTNTPLNIVRVTGCGVAPLQKKLVLTQTEMTSAQDLDLPAAFKFEED